MCLLDRNWEKDQQHFKDFMQVFENHPRPLCVFMCPEGTTFTESIEFFTHIRISDVSEIASIC